MQNNPYEPPEHGPESYKGTANEALARTRPVITFLYFAAGVAALVACLRFLISLRTLIFFEEYRSSYYSYYLAWGLIRSITYAIVWNAFGNYRIALREVLVGGEDDLTGLWKVQRRLWLCIAFFALIGLVEAALSVTPWPMMSRVRLLG